MRALKHVAKQTSAALAMSSLLTLGFAGVAHAATGTYYEWTGASSSTAGLNGCASNCWSVAGNWNVSTDGGVTYTTATNAPSSTDNSGAGDNLVFDNGSLSASVSMTNDIASLKVANINTVNTNSSSYSYSLAGSGMTVTGGVGSGSSAMYINNAVTFTGDQAIGANGVAAARFGGAVTVASGTLTANTYFSPSSLTVASGAAVKIAAGGSAYSGLSGSGSLTILTPTGTSSNYPNVFTISDPGSANAYSGAIDLQKGAQLTVQGNSLANALGTASLTVEDGAQLYLYVQPTNPTDAGTLSLANAITVGGNGAGVDQMSQGAIMAGMWDANKTEIAGTLAVNFTGAVALSSNTTLASIYATATTYNFTKLTQGQHTLAAVAQSQPTYGVTTVQVNGKTVAGGAAGSSAGGTAPKTPDTGFALTSAKPATTLLGTMVVAGGIFAIALKSRKVTSRR